MLGATLFTLCFGSHLAFVGLCLVAAGILLNGAADPFPFAANALMMAGLGVGLSQLYYRVFSGILPKHFFVYIFVNGFFGAAVTIISVGFCSTLLLAVAGAYQLEYLVGEYLPYFLLLAFSEAWLSGMVITLFVVYRPDWVATFEDSRYLAGK
jgi:uncharacterized membrane protein